MKYVAKKSGLVVPDEKVKKEKRTIEIRHIHVYYQEDIMKFLKLLEKEGGILISVIKVTGLGMGWASLWDITYTHHERLDMEIMC